MEKHGFSLFRNIILESRVFQPREMSSFLQEIQTMDYFSNGKSIGDLLIDFVGFVFRVAILSLLAAFAWNQIAAKTFELKAIEYHSFFVVIFGWKALLPFREVDFD